MSESRRIVHLKFALIPTLVIAFLSIYPQISLWLAQGGMWQGSYFVSNYDEPAYSGYVNALAAGKPRVNDPFVGVKESDESLYSIQFVPAYVAAVTSKVLGSTSAGFVFLSIFFAVFSTLTIYWLLHSVTGDEMLSAVGVLVVLCLGTMVAYQGELRFLARRKRPHRFFTLSATLSARVVVWIILRVFCTRMEGLFR